MDRLRLRQILDMGQARLARFANLPIDPSSESIRGSTVACLARASSRVC